MQQHRRGDHLRVGLRLDRDRYRTRSQRSPGPARAIAGDGQRHRRAGGSLRLERRRTDQANSGYRRPLAARALRAECRRGAPRSRRHTLSSARNPRRLGRAPRQSLRPRSPIITRARTNRSACSCKWRPPPPCNEIESIAAVEGVDGIFIGPSDLAADLGHLGNPESPRGASRHRRRRRAHSSRRRKASGILTGDAESAGRYLELGFHFRGGRQRRRRSRPRHRHPRSPVQGKARSKDRSLTVARRLHRRRYRYSNPKAKTSQWNRCGAPPAMRFR